MGTLKETRDKFPRIQWLDSGKPGVPGSRTSLLQVTGKMPTASFGVRAVGHMTPGGYHVNCHAMEFDKSVSIPSRGFTGLQEVRTSTGCCMEIPVSIPSRGFTGLLVWRGPVEEIDASF